MSIIIVIIKEENKNELFIKMQIHSKEIRKYLIFPSHSYLEEEEVMIHQNIIIYFKKEKN